MRTYLQISGGVFGVIALLHVFRLLLDWPAQIAGWAVPSWISWVAILAAGALSLWAFRLRSRGRVHPVHYISVAVMGVAFGRTFFMESEGWLRIGRALLVPFV